MSGSGPGGARGPRVIAGEAGGLRLLAPKGQRTRPTADRVKESLFSALGERVVGAVVLDLFAGSGALAIEALSRGASQAVLVDRDPQALDAIRRNLRTTRLGDRARVLRRGVVTFLRTAGTFARGPYDLVLLDPPYDLARSELATILDLLAGGWLREGATVVLEQAASAGPPPLPAGWSVTWERTYGGTLVVLIGPSTEPPPAHDVPPPAHP